MDYEEIQFADDSDCPESDCSSTSEERLNLDYDSETNIDNDLEDTAADEAGLDSHFPPIPNHLPMPTTPKPTVLDDHNMEDIGSAEEPDWDYTTPALEALKKDLLNGYQLPTEPPPTPFSIKKLDPPEELSLQHYMAWQKSNGTTKAYELHARVLENATKIPILSLYKVERLAEALTDLQPQKVDMCIKSCIAYTGKYAHLEACPYISSGTKLPCNLPRFKPQRGSGRQIPVAQFTALPIKPTIQALYANETTSALMRDRDRCLREVLHLLATASGAAREKRKYSDFGNSQIHVDIHHNATGLFQDERDVAFALSTDGAQLTMKKHSNTWILILILLNLPAYIRYKVDHIIINFATPGPNSPGDMESFAWILFEEMAKCSEGLWIWDAIDSSYFIFRAAIVLGNGDMLGSAKISGMGGHSAVYGDRFTETQAAKSSETRGAKAQYYPMLKQDKYNPTRPQYSYNDLPMRHHKKYFETLNLIEKAQNENQRKVISRSTGIVRLPLCASSPAFFHPTFFPLDPFHLIYENSTAFLWDLMTIETKPHEITHLSTEKAETLGIWITRAMSTLPPAFCGPIRNIHLKRQSQYKVYEWMGLLHFYFVPMFLELGINLIVLENFSHFVRAMELAMTIKERTLEDLQVLRALIVKFLTGFERLYIGDNPSLNSRARLCLFQLIHIPTHIQWNGSIRLGSQATVERSIGEMGHRIRSKKSPFSALTNVIIRREKTKLLLLYHPSLLLNDRLRSNSQEKQVFQKISLRQSDCKKDSDSRYPAFDHLVALVAHRCADLGDKGMVEYDRIRRWGKLRLPNHRVLQSQISYNFAGEPSRRYCWFSVSGPI